MTQLVGILNVTPDSFSDGGLFWTKKLAINRAIQLFADGASIVDVGAESTRPNAKSLSGHEEWVRLKPILTELIPLFSNRISLDTYHPETVRETFKIGPVIVNDVTGLNNPEMVNAIVELNARCIISHMPKMTIQEAHRLLPITSAVVVIEDLLEREAMLISKGLPRDRIILDPGIGFGKTPEVNKQLLSIATELTGHSVMIGYSKKRFLGENRMELKPNIEAGKVAIASGADYLRVHDVLGHMQLLKL